MTKTVKIEFTEEDKEKLRSAYFIAMDILDILSNTDDVDIEDKEAVSLLEGLGKLYNYF